MYDNSKSYFTNVGYVRTSNFQVEYRKVQSQNSPAFNSTVQYVIPKAADLLGISRKNLWEKLKSHEISDDDIGEPA